jgi:anthranilate synthase component 2
MEPRYPNAKELMHGKQSMTKLDTSCVLFKACPELTPVARYHSLAAVEETIPDCLSVIARTEDGENYGVKHRAYEVYGVQFHPESVMTPDGKNNAQEFYKHN